jgi:hypothetical protein
MPRLTCLLLTAVPLAALLPACGDSHHGPDVRVPARKVR